MNSIMKYLPLPEFLIARIKESETQDNTPDKAPSAGLNADVSANTKTTQELLTFRLTHRNFSVVLCVLPSRGQTSVRRIFHQKIQPHMLSKLNIKKIVCDLRRQLVVRGIKLKTLTHAIIRDLIRRLSHDSQIPGRPSGHLSAKRQGLLRHQNHNVGSSGYEADTECPPLRQKKLPKRPNNRTDISTKSGIMKSS
jgi:hypothetical protein